MSDLKNPHDAYFKETLTQKENAESFLQNYLPPEILKIIELSNLEIEKDSFITPELREYFSDLLYKVAFQGKEGYIYILFEHKSYPDSQISLQLLEYMLQCWKLKTTQKQTLPVIIPLVLYHGEKTWTAGLRLSSLLDYQNDSILKYIPDFQYILYDLSQYNDQNLSGIAALQVMLRLLKYIKSPLLLDKLGEILSFLSRDLNPDNLIAITIYVLHTTNIPFDTFVQLVNKNVSSFGGSIVTTTAQRLMDQSFDKGTKQGFEKGIEKGMEQGIREGLEMALEIKFGEQGLICMDAIHKISTIHKLHEIQKLLKKARDLQEFRSALALLQDNSNV